MTHTMYLIGYPGSGKSTTLGLVAAEMGADDLEPFTNPVAHYAWYTAAGDFLDVVELGRRRAAFGGTDALGMSAGPKAIELVKGLTVHESPPAWIIGEGDRLAYRKFLDACPNLVLILLELPPEMARERSVRRAKELDVAPQAESWFRGRVTKVDNLVKAYEGSLFRVDATMTAEHNARVLADMLR